jgi:biopolymer transport protein TolR
MGAKLAGRKNRRSRGVMSEINVTPMVDVMLVLLVIFMVTAPLLTAGVPVNLPKAKAQAINQQDNKPLEVSIDARGNVFLSEARVPMDQLEAKLRAIAAESPDLRVYIRADSKLDYGKVAAVMAAVSNSGLSKIALVTDPTGK